MSNSSSFNIYHNVFYNNDQQAFDEAPGLNFWNSSYPSGGNYWSDYNGTDMFSGPNQDQPGSDGIGDTPYVIDADSQDHYPLMEPWSPQPQDLTPPDHTNESPPIDGNTADLTPTISVHVTDISGVNDSTIKFYINGYRIFHELAVIPNGYNVSYWHESGFPWGEVVTCRIKAEDMLGNLLDFTWNFTVLAPFEIQLHEGWNLISFPLLPLDTSIESVLSSIDGNWDYVQYYDASDTADHWKSYATFKPSSLNDLLALDHTMGFWLHVTNTSSPLVVEGTEPVSTTIPLYAGWNMVGYPIQTNETVANAFWGTGADAVMVGNTSEPYNILEVGPDYVMKPGEGYWVHVPADTNWTVDW